MGVLRVSFLGTGSSEIWAYIAVYRLRTDISDGGIDDELGRPPHEGSVILMLIRA